ncbi:hypothetical protein [Tepidimicrobium xylanilyticum]
MKEFYGSVSFTGRINFYVKANSKEEAEEFVFSDLESIMVNTREGSPVEVGLIEWDLIHEAQRGNVSEAFIHDFEIYEED